MKLLTPEEMRRVDRIAIDEMGIPSLELMERAGAEVTRVIRGRHDVAGKKVVVLCGKGNNGGDGFVIARLLKDAGARVEVFLFCEGEVLGGDAEVSFSRLAGSGVKVTELAERGNGDQKAEEKISQASVVVDALLGTGFSGAPRGRIADAIHLTDATRGDLVAVDAPSGVNMLSGGVEGDAVHADCTVTLCASKQGLHLYPGREFAGEVIVVPIGIPDEALDKVGANTTSFPPEGQLPIIPARRRDAHKGEFGKIVIAGGAAEYVGAPLLAGEAALRSGAGLVSLAVPSSIHSLFAGKIAELICLPLDGPDGKHTAHGAAGLFQTAFRFDTVVAGPGLSRGDEPARFILSLLERWDGPLVIDADGLQALAGKKKEIGATNADLILTPHLGELIALTGAPRNEVESDPIGFIRRKAMQWGVVLLLKGNPTLVADPEGGVTLNTTGNPGMATGGSGDVLSGVIAAMIGNGYPPADAARLAVWLHGRAGDLAAEALGEGGMIAGDIIQMLPDALREVSEL